MVFASILLILFSLVLLALSLSTLYAATYAWWDPEARALTTYPALDGEDGLSFSLIMPCRHEQEDVMRATLERLLSQNHQTLEVLISVGHDDPETVAIAERLAGEDPGRVRVSVDHSPVKNKPRQLNTALRMCRNDIVGVFDAESIAAPNLLRNIDNSFRATGADAVQGAVQLINYRDTWFSLRNCLEYFIWFSSRLHIHARLGFIPLGGNTVFVRRTLLEDVGGWDENCLAEDCELGVRLSTLHHRIVVAYSPELVTREETPDTVRALVKQRTRWSLGFMQVYAKGLWKRLPTLRERATAWWTLTQQHLMALTGLAIPLSIALAIWGKFPLGVTMLTFIPLITTLATVGFEACMFREFGRDHGFAIRTREYAILVLSTPFYQMLLAFAALRAYAKFRTGDFRWEKTAHAGSHLGYLGAGASS
ncbi:glycosyltransferase family 2 protein [Microbacterium pumilum]|uniref:Glycosyl transferase n=1 Tax=Microbacterium pumilum TaxID=344165 RepID=A0ABP5DXV7_9MICO